MIVITIYWYWMWNMLLKGLFWRRGLRQPNRSTSTSFYLSYARPERRITFSTSTNFIRAYHPLGARTYSIILVRWVPRASKAGVAFNSR